MSALLGPRLRRSPACHARWVTARFTSGQHLAAPYQGQQLFHLLQAIVKSPYVGLLFLLVLTPAHSQDTAPSGLSERLSLDNAIALALQANHQQLTLVDSVELAELDYSNARAAYKTKFLASSRSNARSGAELGSQNGLYLKKRNLSGSAISAGLYNSDFGDKSLSELRFTYTLPFFRDPFSKGELALTRASTEFVRRQNILLIAEQELSKRVTGAYFNVILGLDKERIATKQRNIAQRIKTATEIRRDSGKRSEMDYSRAELRFLRAEQNHQAASFARISAEDKLRLLLGMDFDSPLLIDPETQVHYDEKLLNTPLATLEESALANRIEMQGKRDEVDMSRRKLRNVADSKLPEIDIDVHYSLVGEGDNTSDSLDLDDQKWGIGFNMDTDFGGAERKNKRRKLYLAFQAQERELEHLAQQIQMGLRGAQFEARQRARTVQLREQEYNLAQRHYQQAKILHENDNLNQVELLESEHTLHEAEHRQFAAKVDYILSVMELGLASGQYASYESAQY